MAGIDEVLERLVADGDFRAALARDPAAALAAYDLTREDVELLASQLDDGDDAERAVEQRTSKSAMLAMLSSLSFGGGAGDDALAEVKAKSWSWGEVKGDGAVPDDLAATDDETALWELKNAHISSYQTGGSGGDGVPDGVAPDDLAPDDGELGDKPEQIDVLSWSWGETNDDAAVPDDLAAPDDDGELYNKSKGNVDVSWKVEEGVKVEIEPDDLTHKVDPGSEEMDPFTYSKVSWDPTGAAVPADGDELMAVPPDDSAPAAQGQQLGINPPDDGIVGGTPPDDGIVGATPPDDGIVGATPPDDTVVGSTPGGGVGDDADEQGIIVIDTKPEQLGANPPDDTVVGSTPGGGVGGDADEQGIIVINGKEEQLGAIPPDDGIVGGNPPDDTMVGSTPPDDSVVGGTPPDDSVVGGTPPDDGLAAPTAATADVSQELHVEPHALNEALADEVLEIEDA